MYHALLLFCVVCTCPEMTPWSSLSRPTYGHLAYYLCCSSVPTLAAASLPSCAQTSIERCFLLLQEEKCCQTLHTILKVPSKLGKQPNNREQQLLQPTKGAQSRNQKVFSWSVPVSLSTHVFLELSSSPNALSVIDTLLSLQNKVPTVTHPHLPIRPPLNPSAPCQSRWT